MKQGKRVCPICGGDDVEFIKKVEMNLPKEYHLPAEYDIVVCSKCGFCYADTNAEQEDYDIYYSQCNVYSGQMKNSLVGENYIWIKQKLEMLFEKKTSIHILDMGFGKGELLEFLRLHGYQQVYGIDPSEESVKDACDRGVEAYQGSVYDDAPVELYKKMDVVVLDNVLEHLLHPLKALEKIRGLLKEGGYLIAMFPDYGAMEKDNTPFANNFNQEHINYFSATSSNNLFLKAGFSLRILEKRKYSIGVQSECKELVMIYQLKEKVEQEFEKDTITVQAIKNYISRGEVKKQSIDKMFRKFSETQEPIVIWGCGAYVMSLYKEGILQKCNVMAYVDNNPLKIGKKFNGKQIIAPEELVGMTASIVICAMRFSEDILKQIKEMGLSQKVCVPFGN